MAYEEDSSESGHEEPWIQWFCRLKGHIFFCEVERSYIEDGFNLYGLRAFVSNFSDSLDIILDLVSPDESDDSRLSHSACTLYGLIHARYVITTHGLDAMYNKYVAKEFGICPLLQCDGQPVLPVGTTDEMGVDTVKIFCPKCQCVYHPLTMRSRNSDDFTINNIESGLIDGAAFGTTFPHLFFMTFGNLLPEKLSPRSEYIPRVFGFRVYQRSQPRVKDHTSKSSANNSSFSGNNRREIIAVTTSRSQQVNYSGENENSQNRKFISRENSGTLATKGNSYIDLYPYRNNAEEEKLTSRSFSSLPKLEFNKNVCQKKSGFVEKCKVVVNNNDENTFNRKDPFGISAYRDGDVNEYVLPVKPKRQKRSDNGVT